jgi:anaerobic magnesium-protoporphyrin IX monomethyl ester cyclase
MEINNYKTNSENKILFIVPPNITFEDFVNPPNNISTITKNKGKDQFGSLITDMPIGIISLSSYLKQKNNCKIKVIDFNVKLNQELSFTYNSFYEYFMSVLNREEYINFMPDFIGITAMFTPAYESLIDISRITKKIFKNTLILVGGNLPTSMYRKILEDSKSIDAVCYGEGELPFEDLLKVNDKISLLNNHSSWITNKNKSSESFQHSFIYDLDEIPILDYDILDLEGYKLNPTSSRYSVSENYMTKFHGKMNIGEKSIGKGEIDKIYGHSMPIMTSRGCPYHCTFCASHAAHGRKMRYHSPERVINDVKMMIKKFGINGIVIQDDHFMGGGRRPYEIMSNIKNFKIDVFFQNALTIFALKPEFLKLLKDVGIRELVLPVESGSSRVLKEIMRKPLVLDYVKSVTTNCRKLGIYTDCNIILGMPGETKADIEESRIFLKTIYADWFRVFVATPIPGSEMFETCEANDYFKITPLNANYKRAVIETEHMTPEYVQLMTYKMNIELNFVHNSNLRLGNYQLALESFKNVLKVKYDHAIAHYYAAVCYDKLDQVDKAADHYIKAEKYNDASKFWKEYVDEFQIPISSKARSILDDHEFVTKKLQVI